MASAPDIDSSAPRNLHNRTKPTFRSLIASQGSLSDDMSEDPLRRNSSVRFNMKSTGMVSDDETSSPSTLNAANPQEPGEGGRPKGVLQSNSEILEERVRYLENRLLANESIRLPNLNEDGEYSSERSYLSTEPQWMTWQEYSEPIGRATSIMEVLVEVPHTNSRRKVSGSRSITLERPLHDPVQTIKRIRIRSAHIIHALQRISEQTFPNNSCFIIHRPFKILLFYEKEIEVYLAELEEIFSQNTDCPLGDQCKGSVNFYKKTSVSSDSYETSRDSLRRRFTDRLDTSETNTPLTSSEGHGHFAFFKEHEQNLISTNWDEAPLHQLPNLIESNNETCKHELSDDLRAEKEAIIHLRALLKFMKEDMRAVFERHHLLHSSETSEATLVGFRDLWHLFIAGDLVVTDDPSPSRIYRVSILPAGDLFSSKRPVTEIRMRSEGSHKQVESVYKQESMSFLDVDVFYFDFDGRNFGPVEERFRILPYEGEKKVTDLPLFPLRFRKDAASIRSQMLHRGTKFCDLCTVVHREYNGLSAVEPKELVRFLHTTQLTGNVELIPCTSMQIDSQVVIDSNLAYQKYPEKAPKFGLKSWMEDDDRIVKEACGIPGCTECFRDRYIYDDHRIDRQCTIDFIKANRALLRLVNHSERLSDDFKLLLTNRVFGFVLRSRRWHFLDIDSVRPIQRHGEGFNALILPEGVPRLVEGLVQAHSPDKKNAAPASSEPEQREHQVDVVRGKGKGLIILLHGVPGVGKTSTAECVADYTRKPLFPITCGDIGETAKEVEYNLEQNFGLAQKWDCVLLLDEADVFLQARDKEDMRRNSVVSVFLRVLEYYSGILFLTTNKVGHFDEAFKSRIHVALYYPPLDEKSAMQIWKMNLQRLIEQKHNFDADVKGITKYAKRHYRTLEKSKRATWNGRQIKNAFQTAIALAEFDAKTEHNSKPILSTKHFEVVARASEGFDYYLSMIHGTDADRAKREGMRFDDPRDVMSRPTLLPSTPKSTNRYASSSSSSSEESDAKDKKKRKKEKKEKARKKKTKAPESDSDESSSD